MSEKYIEMIRGNRHEIYVLLHQLMFFLLLLVLHRNHRQFLQTTLIDLFRRNLIVYAEGIGLQAFMALSCTTRRNF